MISDYFFRVKDALGKYAHIISGYSTNEKTYSDKKGFIEGEVIFYDESKLDFAEVKDTDEPSKTKYRYHYMDENNKLIVRYDNAKTLPGTHNVPPPPQTYG